MLEHYNKMIDQVGKLFLMPTQQILLFQEKPEYSSFDSKQLFPSGKSLFKNMGQSEQYVLVVDYTYTNDYENPSDLFYKILFKDNTLLWVHSFDIIAVDQKTGIPILSKDI